MSWGVTGILVDEEVTRASTQVDDQLRSATGGHADLARQDAELMMSALQSLVQTATESSRFSVGGHRNDDGSGNVYLNIEHTPQQQASRPVAEPPVQQQSAQQSADVWPQRQAIPQSSQQQAEAGDENPNRGASDTDTNVDQS